MSNEIDESGFPVQIKCCKLPSLISLLVYSIAENPGITPGIIIATKFASVNLLSLIKG